MARIGLNNFRYGILDDETEKYNGALTLGKAIDCKVSLDLNSAELYADDTLAESDYSVKKEQLQSHLMKMMMKQLLH